MVNALPFADATPDRIIWVSPAGSDENTGAENSPLKSIQLAIDRATPGTAILLQPGDYSGNFEFQAIQGTTEKPIWLVAAEGPGTTTITAASNSAAVITFQGEDNLIIKDLVLVGGSSGIAVSQSGSNYTDTVHNVLIEGNTILGTASDGIKISQADNVHVINNVINGAGGEGIDFVGVTGGEISGNEISNVTGTSAGLFVKGGSSDILISNNYIHDVAGDGLLVGGWSSANSFLPGISYEAKNVVVTANVVEDAGKRPLAVLGAQDVDIYGNKFGTTAANTYAVAIASGSPELSPPPASKNVSIHDNIFEPTKYFSQVVSGSSNIVFSNNIKNGVVDGDMRDAPPHADSAFADSLPAWLVDAPVTWATSARYTHTVSGTSGSDNLVGTSGNDFLKGGSSADTMAGGKGDDTYEISTYRDVINENSGSGTDTVQVWSGSYTLAANVENLTVKTGGGGTFAGNALNNIFTGGSGNDTFTGGGGDDLFVFGPGRGDDVLTDFLPGSSSNDSIDLKGFAYLENLSDVLVRSSQVGANTVIGFDSGETLTLSNVNMLDLGAGDFILNWQTDPTPPNEAPTGVLLSAGSLAENATVGTIVGSLSAVDSTVGDTFTYSLIDDAGHFAINGVNVVLTGALDYESSAAHQIMVRATDSAGNAYDKVLTIGVDDVAPSAPEDSDATSNTVAEGAANGTWVGIAATAADINGGAVTYSLLDSAGGRFAIDATTGAVTVANGSLLDHETASQHTVIVRAADASGGAATSAFLVEVADVAPSAAEDADSAVDSVVEGAASGTLVGITAQAFDPNGGAVSYALLDDAGGRFLIDSATGVVTVADGSLLDHAVAAGHTILVQAADASGAASTASFTIEVAPLASALKPTSLIETPPSTPADTNVAGNVALEGVAAGTLVGLTAAAAGDGSLTYSLADDASGRFAIDATTGVVTVADGALLDYEVATEHSIVVKATDTAGKSSATAFVVEIANNAGVTISGTGVADRIDATHAIGGILPTNEEDQLYGAGGSDIIYGFGGNDLINGGSGSDKLYGGMGDDTYVVDSTKDVVIETAGEGFDTVNSSITYTLTSDVENLILTGASTINGIGNALSNVITGNAANNILTGLGGADILNGEGGRDTVNYAASSAGITVSLSTGQGHGGDAEGDQLTSIEDVIASAFNDTVEGSGSNNTMNGGAGIDTASYEHATADVKVNLATTSSQATGGAGSDKLVGFENLTGSAFNDSLTGNGGSNVLNGLAGNDVLNGGGGNDTLAGGVGNDTLTGGAGADAFVFNFAGEGFDTVADFKSAIDYLQISAEGFGGGLAAGGAVAFAAVADLGAASTASGLGYFVYDNAGINAGLLYWDATGGSSDDAVAFARLQGAGALLSSDFHVV